MLKIQEQLKVLCDKVDINTKIKVYLKKGGIMVSNYKRRRKLYNKKSKEYQYFYFDGTQYYLNKIRNNEIQWNKYHRLWDIHIEYDYVIFYEEFRGD